MSRLQEMFGVTLVVLSLFSASWGQGGGPQGPARGPGTVKNTLLWLRGLEAPVGTKVFTDDCCYMERIAAVMCDLGREPAQACFIDHVGGIWQVTHDMLLETKDLATYPQLQLLHYLIMDATMGMNGYPNGINWADPAISITEVGVKPLLNALAARIYLFLHSPLITASRDDLCDEVNQSEDWFNIYPHLTGLDADDFLEADDPQEIQNLIDCHGPDVAGDPHVRGHLKGTGPDSDHPVCYNIVGNDGDIYKLFKDPRTGLEVNIQLIGGEGIWIGRVGIRTRNSAIEIGIDDVVYDGKRFAWGEGTYASNDGDITTETKGNTMHVKERGRLVLSVRRKPGQLDIINMESMAQVSNETGGILGYVGNNMHLNTDRDWPVVTVTLPHGEQLEIPVDFKYNCWQVEASGRRLFSIYKAHQLDRLIDRFPQQRPIDRL